MTSHLIAKNYGGDCDWFTERSHDLPKNYGGDCDWFYELSRDPNLLMYSSIVAQLF